MEKRRKEGSQGLLEKNIGNLRGFYLLGLDTDFYAKWKNQSKEGEENARFEVLHSIQKNWNQIGGQQREWNALGEVVWIFSSN